MNTLKYKIIESPVGLLKIVAGKKALQAILWDNEKINRVKLGLMEEDENDAIVNETEKQLNEYFRGERKIFNLPLEMAGTAFQQAVWNNLCQIPYGVTSSYKDVALKMDHLKAIRAVGTAIGRNPISIVVPCHRVIGTNGCLTGFAGGLSRKKILLDLESL